MLHEVLCNVVSDSTECWEYGMVIQIKKQVHLIITCYQNDLRSEGEEILKNTARHSHYQRI